jgi:hypothetical protein
MGRFLTGGSVIVFLVRVNRTREGEPPGEPRVAETPRLGRSLALPGLELPGGRGRISVAAGLGYT